MTDSTTWHAGEAAGTRWDPVQYQRFADLRQRPALELLTRVPLETPTTVYDLGCGPGSITRLMRERWPDARVCGIDNSRQMLDVAAAADDDIAWREADVGSWQPEGPADLIYSNATLHWLDDHDQLFPRLLRSLAPGGCLAVQMPQSHGLDSHRLMRETLADGGSGGRPLGSEALRQAIARPWVHEARRYYDWLTGSGATVDLWQTEYLHVLRGEDTVLQWVSGTGLRPILNGLDDDQRRRFLSLYRQRLQSAYPPRADGTTLYPFRRLFIVALAPDHTTDGA